jgi:hypothetical protein
MADLHAPGSEAWWLGLTNPIALLRFLRAGRPSDRKMRLFACACCRAIPALVDGPRARRTIEVAERLADGWETPGDRATIDADWQTAGSPAWVVSWPDGSDNPVERAVHWARQRGAAGLADVVREVFGNPFRPAALDPAWLAWGDGTAPKLARALYEERRFADLPILADALEEAGCTNADVLQHLRGGGNHTRGCWALDRVLGWS